MRLLLALLHIAGVAPDDEAEPLIRGATLYDGSVRWVDVNGVAVIADGKRTVALPGRALRRNEGVSAARSCRPDTTC
jgi:hypothetical protein